MRIRPLVVAFVLLSTTSTLAVAEQKTTRTIIKNPQKAPAPEVKAATIIEMRAKVYEESGEIKPLMSESKDILILSSMWDSCIIAMTQLDGYFNMVGIINTIKDKNLTPEAVDYLIKWLTVVKKTNELNVKSLEGIKIDIEARTRLHVDRLRIIFSDMNKAIDRETQRFPALKESLKR